MKKLIIISIFSLFIFSCDDDPVKLWGEYYNIRETTSLTLWEHNLSGNAGWMFETTKGLDKLHRHHNEESVFFLNGSMERL